MEVVRKVKKSKKRRHRSNDDDDKKDEPLEEIGNLYRENCENDFGRKSEIVVQVDASTSCDFASEKDEQVKNLSEKLQQVTSKLYESKNAYTSLKQELNRAQKLLCSEVGENVTASELSSRQGWRGRAEQIHQLQQKVSELQLKISESDSLGRKSLDRRSSSSARIFDRERRQQMENLSQDLKRTESSLESTKRKLEAAKARIAVLENEANRSKRTIALLNEKTTNDKQIIDALNEQLKSTEAKSQDRETEMRRHSDKLEREMVLLRSEIEAMGMHAKNFKRQIDEREREIELLRCRNEIIVDRLNIPGTPSTLPDDSPRSSVRDANECIAIGMAAEAEKDRLLELITVLNRRLDKERYDHEQLTESLKRERGRAAKLESRLQKVELERVGQPRVNTGTYRSRAKVITIDESNDPEEARLRLELLEEECLALKTRLATLRKEKSSDLAVFRKTLDQTRKILKDAYRRKVPTMGCHSSVTV